MTLINPILVLAYLIFTWLLLVHTLEEIGQGVFSLRLGKHQMTKRRYLFAASLLSALNLSTFGLVLFQVRLGLFLGLFMAAVPGILQGVVHTIGYFLSGRKVTGLGVGFYTSIPLSLAGGWLLFTLMSEIIQH